MGRVNALILGLLSILSVVSVYGETNVETELGAVLSEALYLTRELPSVNKPEYLGPNAMAVSKDSAFLYVTAESTRELLVVDLGTKSVTRRVELPASPTGLAVAPDGSEIYVTCMSEYLPVGVVAVVPSGGSGVSRTFEAGHSPRSPVIGPDGEVLFVCSRFSDMVYAYSISTGTKKWETEVVREPYVSAVTPDGDKLIVANYLPDGPGNADTVEAEVTVLRTSDGHVRKHIRLPYGSHNCAGMAISDDGKFAYVGHLNSIPFSPYFGMEICFVNCSRISILDLDSETWVTSVILSHSGDGFSDVWGVALNGDRMVVAGPGSGEIALVDITKMHEIITENPEDLHYSLSWSLGFAKRKSTNVIGGRSVAFVGDTVVVAGYFSDNIDFFISGEEYSLIYTTPLREDELQSMARNPAHRRGERFFNDAKQMCSQSWQSCQSCHPGGRVLGLKWDLENDGNGNYKDARSTLLGHVTPPLMITGLRDSLEAAVRGMIENVLYRSAGHVSEEMQCIQEYISKSRPFPSPSLIKNGLSTAAERGREVFEQYKCGACHVDSTFYTDFQIHEGPVDSKGWRASTQYDGKWNTPTLHEIYRTAPYMHSGGAPTLKDVFLPPFNHGLEDQTITDQQLNDLVEYLKIL